MKKYTTIQKGIRSYSSKNGIRYESSVRKDGKLKTKTFDNIRDAVIFRDYNTKKDIEDEMIDLMNHNDRLIIENENLKKQLKLMRKLQGKPIEEKILEKLNSENHIQHSVLTKSFSNAASSVRDAINRMIESGDIKMKKENRSRVYYV